jgi:RES domain-containing protein
LIQVWRITHERTLKMAFSGDGSTKHGGRWNSRGYRAVYVADSLALATLEILVHGVPYETLKRFYSIPAKIPEDLISKVNQNKLPTNWRKDPPPATLQKIGNQWIKDNRSAVLKVPSAVIPVEFNYVINPDHPDVSKIKIGRKKRHALDVRLTKV